MISTNQVTKIEFIHAIFSFFMLIVLADDFSGAAEIAGITFNHGLTTFIQTNGNQIPVCDVLVIDMNSRSKSVEEAKNIVRGICQSLAETQKNSLFFKKVDSVFRGHLAAELSTQLEYFSFNRILVLPNNPGLGRTISAGQYWIKGQMLHTSAFTNDPDFKSKTSQIKDLFIWKHSRPYQHLSKGKSMPEKEIICTADTTTLQEMEALVSQLQNNDLLCGSGDAFRIFLAKNFNHSTKTIDKFRSDKMLFINGSTFINEAERLLLANHEVDLIYWEDVVANHSEQNDFSQLFNSKKLAFYSTKTQHSKYNYRLPEFAHTIQSIVTNTKGTIHLVITGGATATAILQLLNFSSFEVVEELSSGVVTIKPLSSENIFITTKPGSYPWNAETLIDICNNTNPSLP